MSTVVIIPARLHSARLPRKVLLDIAGKPMIQHVYEAAVQAAGIDAVYIAADSEEIRGACTRFTSNIILTSSRHPSGTDRLAEAVTSVSCDAVINVQGDEPLIDPRLITDIANALAQEEVQMCSAMHRINDTADLSSPHAVKVVTDTQGRALYFSRATIPYGEAGSNTSPRFRHIGIYGYTKAFLQQFAAMPPSPLEQRERLEQLRVLEHGYRIQMIETAYEPIGVDTIQDLERVRNIMAETIHKEKTDKRK